MSYRTTTPARHFPLFSGKNLFIKNKKKPSVFSSKSTHAAKDKDSVLTTSSTLLNRNFPDISAEKERKCDNYQEWLEQYRDYYNNLHLSESSDSSCSSSSSLSSSSTCPTLCKELENGCCCPQKTITQRSRAPPTNVVCDKCDQFCFWIQYNPEEDDDSSCSKRKRCKILDAPVWILGPNHYYTLYSGTFRSLLRDPIINKLCFSTGSTPCAKEKDESKKHKTPVLVDNNLNVLVQSMTGDYYLDSGVEPQPEYPCPQEKTQFYCKNRQLHFQWCHGIWYVISGSKKCHKKKKSHSKKKQ